MKVISIEPTTAIVEGKEEKYKLEDKDFVMVKTIQQLTMVLEKLRQAIQ